MTYTFKCPVCGAVRVVEIPISKYDTEKTKQFCTKCNKKMERVLEWDGPASINGGYEAVAGKASWQ